MPSLTEALNVTTHADQSHKYEFKVPTGTLIHIGGIPFRVLETSDDGILVGGGTNPEHIVNPGKLFPEHLGLEDGAADENPSFNSSTSR